jgi:hypothetical protein
MSMPKGYKKENGYGTSKSLGGSSYHSIAEKMNEKNFKMNHSTARNVFVNSLIKIASDILKIYDKKMKQSDVKKIAIDPRFQEAVAEYMREIQYEKTSKTN